MIKSINEINLESLVAELKLEPSPFKINSTPMTNLLCSNHNHLFIYIEQLGSFLTLTTKIAGNKNESTLINSTSSSTIQYLSINSAPIGNLKKCLISSDGAYILIVCDKSITLVELPSKWGKFDRYEDGKTNIICKSIKLNLGKNQTIIDAIWHVSNSDPNVVVCLTSDNHLRFFRIGTSIGTSQFKEFNLTGDSNLPKDLDQKSFKLLSIDIGSRLKYCEKYAYPIFVLKSNGQVDCLIEYEQSNKFEYLGPLYLIPYCMDIDEEENQVQAFICLRNLPNCLAILLSNGSIYHCLFMTNLKEAIRFYESENNLKEFCSQESGGSSTNGGEAILFVYESIKFEENYSQDFDIQFLRDPLNSSRYFIYHSNGSHSVNLPWLENLQAIYEKEKNLDEFDESKLAEITQLICTKPFPDRDSTVFIMGSTLFYNFAKNEQILVNLTNQMKFVSLNITMNKSVDDYKDDNDRDLFTNYIEDLLKRESSMPLIKISKSYCDEEPNELKLLMNNAINLIKSEYIEKQRLVIVEFKKRILKRGIKRCKLLKQQENLQFEIIKDIDTKLEKLNKNYTQLQTRIQNYFENQQNIKKHMEVVLNKLFARSNVPKSEIEVEIHNDLRAIDHNLKSSVKKIIETRRVFDENQLSLGAGDNIKSNIGDSEIGLIKSHLKNQSDKIKDLIQKVEIISQTFKR